MGVKKEITKYLLNAMISTNSITNHMFRKILTDREIQSAYVEEMMTKDENIKKKSMQKMHKYIKQKMQKNSKRTRSISVMDVKELAVYLADFFPTILWQADSIASQTEYLKQMNDFKYQANHESNRKFMQMTLDNSSLTLQKTEMYRKINHFLATVSNISQPVLQATDNWIYQMQKTYGMSFGFHTQNQTYQSLMDQYEKTDPSFILESKALQWYVEKYTDLIYPEEFSKGRIGSTEETFAVISRYLDVSLQVDHNAIIHNGAIAHLVKLSDMGKLPKEQSDRIKEILSKTINRDNIPVPDMNHYQQYIVGQKKMPMEKMEEFLQKIIQIRNRTGAIPEKYCDYLLSQKLQKKSTFDTKLVKNQCVLRRAVEDKSTYELARNGIYQTDTKVFEDNLEKDIFMKDCLGVYTEEIDNINIKDSVVQSFSKKKLKLINTMFHEIEHAKQQNRMKQHNRMDRFTYRMIKEKMIRNFYSEFYDQNYMNLQNEIDSRIQGSIKSTKYLKSLGMTDEEIVKGDWCTDLKNVRKEIRLRTKVDTKKINGVKRDVNQAFQEIVRVYPGLIQTYPILEIEFDQFGNRKSYMEIIEQYEKENKGEENMQFDQTDEKIYSKLATDRIFRKKNEAIYLETLKNHSYISNSSYVEDFRGLNHVEVNSRMGKLFQKIVIREKLLPKFRQWKKKEKVDYMSEFAGFGLKEIPAEKTDFEIVKANLFYFAKHHPEMKESQMILNDLNGLPILQEYLEEIERMQKSKQQNILEVEFNTMPKEKVETETNAMKVGSNETLKKALKRIDDNVTSQERNEGMNIINLFRNKIQKKQTLKEQETNQELSVNDEEKEQER